MYINNHTLSGNLGNEPEVRDVNGTPVLSFRIANTSPFGKKLTSWYRVSFFSKNANTLANLLSKGSPVVLVGESYQGEPYTDKDGNERQSFEFRATSVQLAGNSGGSNAPRESAELPSTDAF